MAWERRGDRRYYYRSRRVGEKVVKEYVGTGPAAEEAARQDAEQRANRKAIRQGEARRSEEFAAVERLVASVAHQAAELVEAAALAAGYHHHHRLWRKRRGAKKA